MVMVFIIFIMMTVAMMRVLVMLKAIVLMRKAVTFMTAAFFLTTAFLLTAAVFFTAIMTNFSLTRSSSKRVITNTVLIHKVGVIAYVSCISLSIMAQHPLIFTMILLVGRLDLRPGWSAEHGKGE